MMTKKEFDFHTFPGNPINLERDVEFIKPNNTIFGHSKQDIIRYKLPLITGVTELEIKTELGCGKEFVIPFRSSTSQYRNERFNFLTLDFLQNDNEDMAFLSSVSFSFDAQVDPYETLYSSIMSSDLDNDRIPFSTRYYYRELYGADSDFELEARGGNRHDDFTLAFSVEKAIEKKYPNYKQDMRDFIKTSSLNSAIIMTIYPKGRDRGSCSFTVPMRAVAGGSSGFSKNNERREDYDNITFDVNQDMHQQFKFWGWNDRPGESYRSQLKMIKHKYAEDAYDWYMRISPDENAVPCD